MKKKLLLSCAIAVAASVFISCSKDGDISPPAETSYFTLKNRTDQSRLLNLSESSANVWTRSSASSNAITVEAEPSIPANATDITGRTDLSWNVNEGEALYLPAGESWGADMQIYLNTGCKLYVAGELTLNYWAAWGSIAEINVLKGGKIIFTDGFNTNDLKIKVWGESKFEGDFEVNENASFFNYNPENTLTVRNDLQTAMLSTQGTFETVGSVLANYLDLGGSEDATKTFKFGGCVTVDKEFSVFTKTQVHLFSYLSAELIDLDSEGSVIFLEKDVLISAKSLIFNSNTHFVNNSESGYAVIDADYVKIHNDTYLNRLSGGPINLCYKTLEDDQERQNDEATEIEWSSNVVFNQNTYIKPEGCHPGFGKDDEPKDDEFILEHDAVVTSPDIERISATSIDFLNGNVFVSWHERELPYQGYIDVVNMDNMLITATYYTTELDFNHIYVDNQNIYITGGNRNGAFYSEVDYSASANSVDIDIVKVEGSSGNCILKENNEKWIVSGANGGVTTLSGEGDEIQSNYTPLAEAKYITKYGNNMAVLAGINDAKIYEYDLKGSLVKEYSVGAIGVDDGKNTLFVDGSDIYACLGTGGLKVFNNGNLSREFTKEEVGAVNCVDMDDKFIYVANGLAGLMVLDKTTLEVIKEYKLGNASANFVRKGEDGFIYVAYGLKGVHRFKLGKLTSDGIQYL